MTTSAAWQMPILLDGAMRSGRSSERQVAAHAYLSLRHVGLRIFSVPNKWGVRLPRPLATTAPQHHANRHPQGLSLGGWPVSTIVPKR